MESDSRQPDRIDTTVASTSSKSPFTNDNDAAATTTTTTTASPAAMTPSSSGTPATPSLARAVSTSSRFSRMSQGTRRSRFVEALDDDRDDDLDLNYETGSYRGRSSIATRSKSIRSVASYASLQQRRRSRSSSLGIETGSAGGGGPARGSSVPAPGGTGGGGGGGGHDGFGGTPTSGKRQVSFNFPLLPPTSGSDTSGTPTTPGFNDRTARGVRSNPFSDVYGMADSRSVMDQSTTSLVRDVDGMDYRDERSKGGFGADAKGAEAGMPSPKLEYFFEGSHQPGFNPTVHCPARRHFFRTRWVTSSIILISIYATIVSGLFFAVALRGPEWPMIRSNGWLTPSNASLLVAVLAKTVELSFGSSIVAFLGQVLSRRSLSVRGSGKGVTLAEMSMRNWIGSPGYMVSNFETVRYALFSILGIISFIAAIVATVYTSASDALVQPQLKLGALETKIAKASVLTKFANSQYLGYNCETPITVSEDEVHRNATCLDITYAAQSYHDYQRYVAEWDYLARNKTAGTTKESRVPAFSQFHSEILVNGTWLDVSAFEWSGRIINNVTLAMPHAGVLSAAWDERNDILQPSELGGLGAYNLVASVPSPAIHVLCANMNRSELAPIVFTAWNDSEELDAPTWPEQISFLTSDESINKTVVDDLFGWRKNGQNAPIFPRYPSSYNTVLNQTFFYGRESLYLLGRDGDEDVERYSLCQLKASLTPNCSTTYSAVQEGSSLSSTCDPENDPLAYIHSDPGAESGSAAVSLDWPWVATEWANSMSLSNGIMDGKASIARLLTQSIVKEPTLQLDRPSLAEALAVLASTTLLLSTQDAQMDMDWPHDEDILLTPETINFNATLRERTYASGPTGEPQKLFYLVLVFAFLTNVLCLAYFIFHRGLVTDFSEPPNLFSLAVNSPPSASMAGSCGGGPAGRQWAGEWFIGESGGHLFIVPKEAVPAVVAARGNMGNAWRVEEEASWPVEQQGGAHHHHAQGDFNNQHYYGQLSQHNNNNNAGGPGGPLAVSTSMSMSRGSPDGPNNNGGGDGLFARMKQRFSSSSYGAANPNPYARSPDTPSSMTRVHSSLGTGMPPPGSAWSNRSFGSGGGGEYFGLSGGGGGGSPPSSSGLYPTTTRGTAYTGASGVSAYEMMSAGGGGGGMASRDGPGPGPGIARPGTVNTNSPISRAYSKLSRKRTFL
ncbi:uncharacterized protein BKCO1_3100033 [Diplodia corticola]|uniref:Mcm2 3 5 family protein n=1 Tax=Diplodia corticola TaxID=236234 RepID=A0A1J9RYC6_9PEZI|nr:uncharacterized protein BKCO1_3100033 [Diplodia corticola]OJD33351.1 hypothetical protein BKCO1_3100033 [Diplodia corticola]